MDQGWTGPFFFVAIADPQLGTLHNDKHWQEELDLLYKAIAQVNRLRPAFVIFLGDLVNAWPDRGEELAQKQAEQVEDFKSALSALDEAIPVFFASGNHDLGNSLTEEALALFRQRFGDDYFKFTCRGLRGVVLNTQAFCDDNAEDLARKQISFLKQALKDDADDIKCQQRVVFGHISPFLFAADEPKGFFNMDPKIRGELMGIAKEAGVRMWMSGHYHRNACGWDGELESVTTSAIGCALHPTGIDPLGLDGFDRAECGANISGFRIVRVYEDRLEHEWFTVDNFPDSVTL
eukprot:m.52181 g.52181  ORF g.52181 m.52181 type:complete len:292 (+) comp12685_c0_seq1:244-1119(+)